MALIVQSLDAAFEDDRLHFSYIDDPTESRFGGPDRVFKDTATVRLTNPLAVPVTILDLAVDGPFVVEAPSQVGASVPPGGFVDVTVRFERTLFDAPTGSMGAVNGASAVFTGRLDVATSAGAAPPVTLAGLWQPVSEQGFEPNVNEIWEAFGFGNRVEGLSTQNNGARDLLDTQGALTPVDETEVFSPYWRIADPARGMKITDIASYSSAIGPVATNIHAPGSIELADLKRLWRVTPVDTQIVLPDRVTGSGGTAPATLAFSESFIPGSWLGDAIFGFYVEDSSTDTSLNISAEFLQGTDGSVWRTFDGGVSARSEETGEFRPVADLDLIKQGAWIRVFQAIDASGAPIENTYLMHYDNVNGNYDYNDAVAVIEGIEPARPNPVSEIRGLTPGAPDDRLVFTNIENPNVSAATQAIGGQVWRDEATLTLDAGASGVPNLDGISIVGPDADAFDFRLRVDDDCLFLTVEFTGDDTARDGVAERYEATLVIGSNPIYGARHEIDLAGLAQNQSELQQEPTVEDIVWAFGFDTDVGQDELAVGGGLVRQASPDEVITPYFEALDPTRPVEVLQLASFLRQNDVARLSYHGLDSAALTNLYATDDQQGQTVSPEGLIAGAGSTGFVASSRFRPDAPFGFKLAIDDRPTFAAWSDPEINERDPAFAGVVDADSGHLMRFFVARTVNGTPIEGTYIGIQDYAGGGNFDYQDHVFLVRNVSPFDTGGVNPALVADADSDGIVDFFDGLLV